MENPLQHRLTKEELEDFVKDCRAKANSPLQYITDELFFKFYLEGRGVIAGHEYSIYHMNHTFKNASWMSTRDEIMEDAVRYYTVFIHTCGTVVYSAFKKYAKQGQKDFDMSEEEIEAHLLRIVEELNSEKKYIDEAAFGFQFSLILLYSNSSIKMKEQVGDLLVEIKYNDMCNIVDIIGKVEPKDAFKCNNVYALAMITFFSTRIYSQFSQHFVLYLTNLGLLTTLTVYITESRYLNYLHIQPFYSLVEFVLAIVYKMAYHSDSTTKLKFDATKKALLDFPKIEYDKRDLLITMALIFIMDEHELDLLPDESNVVNMMIAHMEKVFLNKDNSTASISLQQCADCLSKLTIKSSNIPKIVHTKGALSALVKILLRKDVKENASAVRCIHALAQDSTVRNTLLEFPNLVSAMEYVGKTSSLKIKKIIEDTLKILSSCTPVSGAFAGANLIAETTKPTEDIALLGQSRSGAIKQLAARVSQLSCYSPHENQRLAQQVVNYIHLDQSNSTTILVKQEGKENFTARGKSEKLRPEDEETLRRHWEMLIEAVDATHIIMELISRGVFDVDDKREIFGPESHKKRTEIMLEKLLNAGPGSAFQTFLDVLDISHDFVAKKLRE